MKKTIILLSGLLIVTGCTGKKEEKALTDITVKGVVVGYTVAIDNTTIEVDIDNDKVSDYTIVIDDLTVNNTGTEVFKKENEVTIKVTKATGHAIEVTKNFMLETYKVDGEVIEITDEFIIVDNGKLEILLYLADEIDLGTETTSPDFVVGNTVKVKVTDIINDKGAKDPTIIKIVSNE